MELVSSLLVVINPARVDLPWTEANLEPNSTVTRVVGERFDVRATLVDLECSHFKRSMVSPEFTFAFSALVDM
ncbi:hypothetical protein D3C71_986180 [compost metagenome]